MNKELALQREISTKGEKRFRAFSYAFLIALTVISLAPFLLIVIASFTDESTLINNGYSFLPEKFSLGAYQYMLGQSSSILHAYFISFSVTIVGTLVSVILTSMLAYPMSRRDFPFRSPLAFFVFFTMLFNGGVVPAYIMWSRIFHLQNTIFALILPNYLVTAFNVFLMRNYYKSNIPVEMIEAARIDGASEMSIFTRIMLPLSIPAIATVGTFTALVYWNDWTNSLYYIRDANLYSIQYYLIALMENIRMIASGNASITSGALSTQLPSVSIRMALAVVGTLPIMVAFPFFQKYFIKGAVVGAVKG